MQLSRLWYALVRFVFRLLYHEMAWTYDVVSWAVSLGAWRQWQQAALPFVQGRRVLEIGHGPGHVLHDLESADFRPIGLDLSPYMGRLAQKHTLAPLVRGNVQTLPFASETFETVLATFPTQYILQPDTLNEIYRVLQQNGRLLVVPEGHLTGHGVIHRVIDWLFRVTGQRNDLANIQAELLEEVVWQPFRASFTAVGFTVQIHTLPLPGSVVTVMVAEKAASLHLFNGR